MKQKKVDVIKNAICMVLIMTMVFSTPINHLRWVFAEEATDSMTEEISDTSSDVLSKGSEDILPESKLVDEDKEKREQNVKHFIREDGLTEAVYYAHSVHYENNGKWEDIDNSLEAVTENGVTTYKNKSNSFEISFADNANEDALVSMKNSGSEISWAIPEMTGSAISIENGNLFDNSDMRYSNKWFSTITYSNGLNGMDVTYVLTPDGVREYFIVENESDLDNLEDITIVMKAKNLTVTEEFSKVSMKNTEGKEVFKMQEPVMFDAQGAEHNGLTLEVKEVEAKVADESTAKMSDTNISKSTATDKLSLAEEIHKSETEVYLENITEEADSNYYTYTLSVDKEKLSNVEYPLIIDPDITTDVSKENIDDAFVCSSEKYCDESGEIKFCDYPFGTNLELLKVGYGVNSGESYSYIKMNEFPDNIGSDDMIVNATLRLVRYGSSNYTQMSGDELDLHEVTSPWVESEVTWNTKPTWNARIESFSITKDVDNDNIYGGFNDFDVTRLVKKWYNGEANYGVMIKSNIANNHYYEFCSSELYYHSYAHPVINIVYKNTRGIESTYSYHEQTVGRAGAGYVADHTGNLTFVHADASTNGGALSINLKHVFDNVNKDTDTGYGKGWRLNYDETIEKVTIGNKEYYAYTDSDGTIHYYVYNEDDETYYDEMNKKNVLTISESGEEIKLTSLPDNISSIFSFDGTKGYLKEIKDNNNNKIQITRSNNKISSLTDSNGYHIYLDYDDTGKLEKVRNDNSLVMRCYYTDNRLTEIKYADGKTSNYTYNSSGCLSSVEEINGYKIVYEYTGNPQRVSKVTEYDNGSARNYLNFTYGRLVTTVEDRDGDINHYRFNIYGQVVNVQDEFGYSQSYDYVGSEVENRNKLSAESDITATYINLIDDSSFEYGKTADIWNLSNGTGNASAYSVINKNSAGAKQLKFQKTISSGGSFFYTYVHPEAGKTYNFSCLLRGSSKVYLYMMYTDSDGELVTKKRIAQTKISESIRNSMIIDIPSDFDTDLAIGILFESGTTGTVYIDDVQFVEGVAEGEYNILQNSDFTQDMSYWTTSNCVTNVDKIETVSENNNYKPENLSNKVYKMVGDINKAKTISQTTTESGSANETYVFGGYVKAESVMPFDHVTSTSTTEYGRTYLKVDFMNNGTLVNSVEKDFMCETFDWQYLSFTAQAEGDFTNIVVSACYKNNRNTAYFDGFHLYSQGQGSAYKYDENDDLTEIVNKDGESSLYQYNEDHTLSSSTDKYNVTTTYTYDENKNLITASSQNMVSYNTYDSYGNVTSQKSYHTDTENSVYYISRSVYDSTRKNQKIQDIDARGNTVSYTYNNIGILDTVTDSKDTIEYSYDSMNRVYEIESINTGNRIQYAYTNDNLSGIVLFDENSHRTFYTLDYNTYGQLVKTKVGTRVLSTNTYDPYTRLLSKVSYGNGYEREYYYDDRERLICERDASLRYRNYYGDDGKLYERNDLEAQRIYYYNYDDKDRIKGIISIDEGASFGDTKVVYSYNDKDLVSSYTNTLLTDSWGAYYTYDDLNRLTETTVNNGETIQLIRDKLGRVSEKNIGENITSSYTYVSGDLSGSTTNLVSTFSSGINTSAFADTNYTYDSSGLLLTEFCPGYVNKKYHYDSLSQLICVEDDLNGITYDYLYDAGGNILTRTVTYDESEGTTPDKYELEYVYDSTWKDLLIEFDGQTIEYDAIGNPTKYLEYSNLTWEGRTLEKINKGTETIADYEYDADGIRTKKTVGGVVTDYIYIGGQLSALNVDDNMLYFTYDANGGLISVNYDGTEYYYILNPFGDVIALCTADGTVIERYEYDEYGVPVLINNSEIGQLNPFRYRGYIYDEETGFYYLKTRYYDPATGRFINSDGQYNLDLGVVGLNLFAYCSNNPMMHVDSEGTREIDSFSVQSESSAQRRASCIARRNVGIGAESHVNDEMKEFAATVYSEAGGQNDITKAAVAHVIINRIGIKDSWGYDIISVISCGEFCGYGNSRYDNAMHYYNTGECSDIYEKEAMERSMEIIIPIYNGFESDITGGALYFHSNTYPEDWVHHYYYTQIYIDGTELFWFYK